MSLQVIEKEPQIANQEKPQTLAVDKEQFIKALREYDRQKSFRFWDIQKKVEDVQAALNELDKTLDSCRSSYIQAESKLRKTVLGDLYDEVDWDGWMNQWNSEWDAEQQK